MSKNVTVQGIKLKLQRHPEFTNVQSKKNYISFDYPNDGDATSYELVIDKNSVRYVSLDFGFLGVIPKNKFTLKLLNQKLKDEVKQYGYGRTLE